MTESAAHVRIIEETSGMEVLFDNRLQTSSTPHIRWPPGSARSDGATPSLGSSYSRSANPEFYLSHFDLTARGNITTAVGFRPSDPDGTFVVSPSPRWSASRKSAAASGA